MFLPFWDLQIQTFLIFVIKTLIAGIFPPKLSFVSPLKRRMMESFASECP